MNVPLKVIAPRVPTPVTRTTSRSTAQLPDDVVAEQVQRLQMFALVSGGMWLVGLLLDLFVFPRMTGQSPTRAGLLVQALGILSNVPILLYVRYAPRSAQTKCDAGLWLMMLNAFGITLLETWAQPLAKLRVGQVSWIVVVILLSAIIMPGAPRKMLAAALVSATMGPLGVWFAYLRGEAVPSIVETFIIYIPNYTCAIAAIVPSRMFQRMGRRLREARELGNYELVELLGHGGMGEVWRAKHRLLARHAAVKVVRPEVLGASNDSQGKQLLRRFEREAQATAALTSQHSIRLFDFGATDEGSFYYVMELLTGRDLESLVNEFGPLPPDRAMYLLRQVCHSLAEAHEGGLVHRDVKPANLYVCRMGLDYDFVKVLDFGLVKFGEQQASLTETQSVMTGDHTTVGTPAYMAPEIVLGLGNVDRRADVYALGCVAYFLLTGQPVFQGGTAMQTLIDHVHKMPCASV